MRPTRAGGWWALVALAGLCAVPAPTAGQESNGYENLQALPADITRDDLGDTMLGFLRALGLPRRAGEGCLHCHVGSLDVPRSQWEWSSDEKPNKATARRMIRMVQDINREHLAGLDHRDWPALQVGCVTCHAGRLDPRPIEDVLGSALALGGVDSVAVLYPVLHERYYGAGVYDLRVGTLASMASRLAEEGRYEDALKLSAVNETAHSGDPGARRVTLALRIQRALDESGPESAVEVFHGLRETEPDEALGFSVLDGIGWRTYRIDRQEDALALFRANREAYPDLYFTFESLVEARHGAGEISREEIIAAYEAYLQTDPDNEMAQAQLTNHRRQSD
ncbi:MAG: c-type cytochrome [Gemmatimonadetes bacterium]|nr:c-type cytochrome [Gemmatimonadota bacterium]